MSSIPTLSKDSNEVLSSISRSMKENEVQSLFRKAAFSQQHNRKVKEPEDFFPPYKQDLDRILQSKAVHRYSDKTQVVYLVHNDHLTHRGLHVQLVSAFARGIASALRLNIDLVEAIAIGHDVGHPPFGHEGEVYLSALTKELGLGAFSHARQSCRLLSEIEPLNLGFLVYDGFLCHDGGLKEHMASPRFSKNWEVHFAEQQGRLEEPEKDFAPASLEGCLVKMCDTVSYIGKDIEDAIILGIIKRDDIPNTKLGSTNKEILRACSDDLITNSYEKEYISFSDTVFSALRKLRAFNFERIYTYHKLKVQSSKIQDAYRLLYERLEKDYEQRNEESLLFKGFLHSKSHEYILKTTLAQKIVDYIAGMTDTYFVQTLETLVVPQQIIL
jgi:dGTPase